MKITKLLEAPYKTDFTVSKTNMDSPSDMLHNLLSSEDKIGSGRTAVVTGDTDPHMVNRRAKHISQRGDSEYDIFAKWVVSNENVRQNPHFPRIYVVDTKQANGEGYTARTLIDYKIEKLTPMDKLSPEEVRAIMDTHFAPVGMSREEYNDYEFTYNDIAIFTFEYIHSGESSEDIAPVGKFRQACDMLENFLYEEPRGLIYDLHWENIMVRRTGRGLQLVFTDPVAYTR